MGLQQGNDKHGAIRDDLIKKHTEAMERGGHEAFLEERREAEPLVRGAHAADLPLEDHLAEGAPAGMTRADVDGRAELARSLQPSVFPAHVQRLVESAVEMRAPDRVVRALADLPRDRMYRNVQEVWHGLGGGSEDVTHRA